jgi:dihydropyrimidinase
VTLNAGRLPLQKFVEVTSTNAAKLYGLYPKKGAMVPGLSDADLVIWYPPDRLAPFKLNNDLLHHNVDYTPFEGMDMRQWPRYTILRGKVVWDHDHGGLQVPKGMGKFLSRGKSTLPGPRRKKEWDVSVF